MEENNVSKKDTQTTEGNLPAALTYFAGWITGLVFLLTEKEDDFIRFNAAQSIVVFGALNVLSLIPLLGQLLLIVIVPLGVVLWVVLMYKAYKNEKFELPVASDLAKQLEKALK